MRRLFAIWVVLFAPALRCKLGQLRINAPRDKARATRGDRFGVRRFHAAPRENGPLALLERQIARWIGAEGKIGAPARASPVTD